MFINQHQFHDGGTEVAEPSRRPTKKLWAGREANSILVFTRRPASIAAIITAITVIAVSLVVASPARGRVEAR